MTRTPERTENQATDHSLPDGQPLTEDEVADLDAWFRAANYLSVGQIYLLDNPLLERTLVAEDI